MERNIRLLISYDGSRFHGWQRQKDDTPTIQGIIEGILRRITQQSVTLIGAGRTDAGVHAWGQVANFSTVGPLSSLKIKGALNALLPPDILIREVQETERDFHARYSSQSKVYDYYLCLHPQRIPFFRFYSWFVKGPLDLKLIEEGLSLLRGEHDFSAFRTQGSNIKSPVRTLYRAGLWQNPQGGLRLRFKANGFLRNMVRNMVGILVRVGLKEISLKELEEILISRDRSRAGEMAPAQGLFLRKVFYPREF